MKEEVGVEDPEITVAAREKVLETLDVMLADFNSQWGDDASIQLTYQIGHHNCPIGVHHFAVLAHVLDPRFKRLRNIHPDRKADVWKWLEEETVKGKEHQRTQENGENVMELGSVEVDHPDGASTNGDDNDVLQKMFMISDGNDSDQSDDEQVNHSDQTGYAQSLAKNEISCYKQEKELEGLPNYPLHRMGKEVLLWWKAQVDKYPNLSALARRILAIPATSAPSERLFSQSSLLLTKKQSHLPDDNASKLMFLNGCWELVEDALDVDG
ncbi:hypothetical protein EMCRGX_G018020 [Ephydatia muelleri]